MSKLLTKKDMIKIKVILLAFVIAMLLLAINITRFERTSTTGVYTNPASANKAMQSCVATPVEGADITATIKIRNSRYHVECRSIRRKL